MVWTSRRSPPRRLAWTSRSNPAMRSRKAASAFDALSASPRARRNSARWRASASPARRIRAASGEAFMAPSIAHDRVDFGKGRYARHGLLDVLLLKRVDLCADCDRLV